MELQRERVPNRSIQADTKMRKMAIAEMAKAIRSPIEPLRERKQAVRLSWNSSHLSPLSSVGQSPVGILDAAAVHPEEEKQKAVEGQKA